MGNLRLQVPPLSARVTQAMVAATLAKLVASGTATTKTDLCTATGLSRTTVDKGLETLFDVGALRVGGLRDAMGRGRRAGLLEVEADFGAIVVIDFGARTRRIAVANLGQDVVAEEESPSHLEEGPEAALDAALRDAERLVEAADLSERQRITVVAVPGPVDTVAGMLVRPPIMPGWDGFPIKDYVARALGGIVVVVNDVNVRALGEARARASRGPLLYVKVGTGIGAGLASGAGDLLCGADGAAGDIGHLRAFGSDSPCRCGRAGCLEAMASVSALAQMVDPPMAGAGAVDGFVEMVRQRDPRATELVRTASAAIGDVVASLVHFFNPAEVLIGGDLAAASDDLLAGVRTVVYSRALPLATRNLSIRVAPLGARAGIAGAIVLGSELALGEGRFEELLAMRARTARLASAIRHRADVVAAA